MKEGFTFLELLISIGIFMILLGLALPSYQKNIRQKAAVGAARFFEAQYQETKERAVALGMDAGLCVDEKGSVQAYEYDPFSTSNVYAIAPSYNLGKIFSAPIRVSFAPASTNRPVKNPCSDLAVFLSPAAGASADWQGIITVSSGGSNQQVYISGGSLTDGE